MAIIDGTGVSDDTAYNLGMENSFCHQLYKALGPDKSQWKRGPNTLGKEVEAEAIDAANFLREKHKANPCTRLFLAGYSRGSSAAVMAAEILNRTPIAVDSLFLFDAVARHPFWAGRVVPANVHNSFHALRENSQSIIRKYENTIDGHGFGNPMRPSFGHTAENCTAH